ncbi:methyltransferase domain-containing protein [Methylohalobius crimeensis]|uniref:methyltransferase domain-containing protein n=1 Tax=Methylohalobius crimeensis TaxID=244365 RepID=UPI0003B5B601|nr:methyltransferase domain-containing protein [Methylohalobius crimeensis]
MSQYKCLICGYETDAPEAGDVGACRGNTARFRDRLHNLWKCPNCFTIHNIDPVDFEDIYRDYPLNKRCLDIYARGTLSNLLRRLRRAGLTKQASILDYGCGNGVFVQYLEEKSYTDVSGYDPFVAAYSKQPERQFDCVVGNDVIEHVADPRQTIRECSELVRPGGLLYLGTADSEPVKMNDLESHLMRLHQPFHRLIVTEKALHALAEETGFEFVRSYRRSYMDTLIPFSNYRFLDEFSRALGHDMDLMLDPASAKVMLRRPRLWFYAFWGYFFPSAFEPAVVLRRPLNQGASK